jgi:hypothetical protein
MVRSLSPGIEPSPTQQRNIEMSGRRQIIMGRIAHFFGLRPARDPQALSSHRDMQLVVDAIRRRETTGDETSLRALHRITPLSQSDALRAVAVLEQAGLVVIMRNMSDELASTVELSEGARSAGIPDLQGRAA